MDETSKKLLILDLDETLIHATARKLEIKEDFKFDKYFIYKRPFLENFLIEMSKYFTLGIWSSADDKYVLEIVNLITPNNLNFEIVWGRSKCSKRKDDTFDEYYFEKRLDKLKKKGFKLEEIIIVDDTPEKSRTNYGNAVHIKEFSGSTEDQELKYLQDYIVTLKDVENIRQIEKRKWRFQ